MHEMGLAIIWLSSTCKIKEQKIDICRQSGTYLDKETRPGSEVAHERERKCRVVEKPEEDSKLVDKM